MRIKIKLLIPIIALTSVAFASDMSALFGLPLSTTSIERGDLGSLRSNSPHSFIDNPANSSSRIFWNSSNFEIGYSNEKILPGIASEDIIYDGVSIRAGLGNILGAGISTGYSKSTLSKTSGKEIIQSGNLSANMGVLSFGVNLNKWKMESDSVSGSSVLDSMHTSAQSFDFGLNIRSKVNENEFAVVVASAVLPNAFVSTSDWEDFEVGNEFVGSFGVELGKRELVMLDFGYQVVEDPLNNKIAFTHSIGGGVIVLNALEAGCGYLRDSNGKRFEFHYGYGLSLSYRNIRDMMKIKSGLNQRFKDFGIFIGSAKIRSANGNSVRDGQGTNEISGFVNIEI